MIRNREKRMNEAKNIERKRKEWDDKKEKLDNPPDTAKECKCSRVHPLPVGAVLHPKGVNSSSAQDTSVEAAHKKHRNYQSAGHLSARSPASKDKVDCQVGEEHAVAKLCVGVPAKKPLDSFLPVDEEEGGSGAELLLTAGEVLDLVQGQISQRLAGECPGHQDGNGAGDEHHHQWL